jgi:hypothetical protein
VDLREICLDGAKWIRLAQIKGIGTIV